MASTHSSVVVRDSDEVIDVGTSFRITNKLRHVQIPVDQNSQHKHQTKYLHETDKLNLKRTITLISMQALNHNAGHIYSRLLVVRTFRVHLSLRITFRPCT